MKLVQLFIFASAFLISIGGRAETSVSPLSYLNEMTKAHRYLNYEQYYLFQEGESVTSWRYRHSKKNGKEYAQLLALDGNRKEYLLQDNRVGYFGHSQPFTLQTDRILDNLPIVIHTDFNLLEGYSFIDMGRERIANKVARVIRVVPKDDFRYQYRLWIDEESYLLLKSELLDNENSLFEQFRVLLNVVDGELQNLADPIQSLILPPMIPSTANISTEQLQWQPEWLPQGFKLKSVGKAELTIGEEVDSQLYSDGLFSFTLYLAKNNGIALNDRFWQDGKTTIYTQTVGKFDVIIIGELPVISAKRIAQNMRFPAENVSENRE